MVTTTTNTTTSVAVKSEPPRSTCRPPHGLTTRKHAPHTKLMGGWLSVSKPYINAVFIRTYFARSHRVVVTTSAKSTANIYIYTYVVIATIDWFLVKIKRDRKIVFYWFFFYVYRVTYCLQFYKSLADCWSRTDDCDSHATRARRRLHRGARVSRLKRTGKLTVIYRETGAGKSAVSPQVTWQAFFFRTRLLRHDCMTTTLVTSYDVVFVSLFYIFLISRFTFFENKKKKSHRWPSNTSTYHHWVKHTHTHSRIHSGFAV